MSETRPPSRIPIDEYQWICDALREIRNPLKNGEAGIEEPWQHPRTWKQFKRQREWLSMRALDEIRMWWLDKIKPMMERIELDMEEGGFDPDRAEHFAATQALLVAVPDNTKGMTRAIETMAGFYGHCKNQERNAGGQLSFDEIHDAMIVVVKRLGSNVNEKPVKEVKAKVIDVEARGEISPADPPA